MKTITFLERIKKLGLSAIVVLLLGAVYSLGFSAGNAAPPANTAISSETANVFFKNYYNSARSVNSVIKGFSIDMEQYNAMSQIIQQGRSVSGFKIYFGLDNSNSPLGLVVGVNGNGAEITTMIMSTSAGTLASCPIACDEASAITQE